MKTITLKNFPDELLKQLKERAKNNHRSLNSEIIHILAGTYGSSEIMRQGLMERARKIRESLQQHLSEDEINAAKNEGRS